MRMIPLFLVTVAVFGVLIIGSIQNKSSRTDAAREFKARFARKHVKSVDHAKLPALQKTFASGREVTEACIGCHTERHKEVMASSHWNWSRQDYIPGRGVRTIGKRNVLNNFCIGVSDNQEGCSRCHAGYGMDSANFDFNDPRNVDCLVCHDNTDSYAKGLAGMPDPKLDLKTIAQKVGRPQKSGCGACHFSGGGGNNVKHGDLEQGLLTATREVDVHMASDGADLDCVSCHTAENHRIRGRMYSVSSLNRERATCEQCHGGAPHQSDVVNRHTAKVACQTCHIPRYAKVNETKMAWDWSTAGKLRNGEPIEDKDAAGNPVYASIKGSFVWARNVKPEYVFFNGTADHYLLGDQVPAARPVQVNVLHGSYDDPDSKITPVKVHHGKQIYDPVNNILVQPKLYSRAKGDGGFWKDFNWKTAAEEGMKASGLPYSGRYEFVATEMYWPVNHMVSPKEKSVDCVECHTPNDSRMAGLKGFYMPGRDRSGFIDGLGAMAVFGALAAALAHAVVRLLAFGRRKAEA